MSQNQSEFERASEESRQSIVSEFVYFLKENKKWWLLPILLVIAAIGALALASNSPLAPFIYTMF